MERIRYLRQEALEGRMQRDYENMFRKYQLKQGKEGSEMSAEALERETDALREKMEELKKDKLDCFKLCFRLKVADAVHFERLK